MLLNCFVDTVIPIISGGCETDQTLIESDMDNSTRSLTLDWPETNIGVTANVPCPCGENISTGNLQATRYCSGNFRDGSHWEDPNDSPCHFSDIARKLCNRYDV